MPPKKQQLSQPVQNSIRMDSDHLDELFDEIEASTHGSAHDPRRSHVRWQFRKTAVPMQVYQPGGSATTIQVACRNMSSVGMSVFHSSFLHNGTRVVVSLTDTAGNAVKVEGTIVRCSHVRGICHELGVKFKHSIDARNFVKLDPFAEGFNLEKVNPQTVEGTVLYIDGSEMGQSLLKHFLRETRTRLRLAGTIEEARQIADEGVDLILCDCAENGRAVADFVAGLRKKGSNVPAAFLTTEVDAASTAKYKMAQASAIIAKPLTQDVLLRAMGEFLAPDREIGVTISSLPPNHPSATMLSRFIQEVNTRADELDAAVRDRQHDAARIIALQIAGVAPTMGFPKLALLAQNAEQSLRATMSVDESLAPLAMLMRLCRDVRLKKAA